MSNGILKLPKKNFFSFFFSGHATTGRCPIQLKSDKFGCPRDARFGSNVFVAEEEVHVLRTSVRGLEMPVVECPSYARGACPFLCPWSALCFCLLHMYNKFVLLYGTVVQYEKRADTNERTNEPRTKFHLIERIILSHNSTPLRPF